MSRIVLPVDDYARFRARARMLLEVDGYGVIGEGADGATAMTKARRLRPGLMLLDVQLPEGDGFDVAVQIIGDVDAPAVVLRSSRDWSDSADPILRRGACGFLPKDQLSGGAVAERLA